MAEYVIDKQTERLLSALQLTFNVESNSQVIRRLISLGNIIRKENVTHVNVGNKIIMLTE